MTIEEKRSKIAAYCTTYGCRNCPLEGVLNCWGAATAEEIENNYKTLFGYHELAELAADPVNHPAHYTQGGIECIDAIQASMTVEEYAGYLKGQVIKYIWRYKHKGKPAEDLKKARFYLDRLIGQTEGGGRQ